MEISELTFLVLKVFKVIKFIKQFSKYPVKIRESINVLIALYFEYINIGRSWMNFL